MNMSRWGARVANWYKKGAGEKPLEWHISHAHEEVSEVFGALRDIQDGNLPPEPLFPKGVDHKNKFAAYWFDEDGHPEGFGIELADAALKIAYIADVTGVPLETFMELKMKANEQRRAR